MTPRQFLWLRERHKQYREYQELLVGIPTSTLANHSFAQPKKPYKPTDFMPSYLATKEAEKPKRKWTRKTFANDLVTMRQSMPTVFRVRGDKSRRPGDVVLPANVQRKQWKQP